MYPASCSGSHISRQAAYKQLFSGLGGQVSGEGPCGIYYNIISHCAEYVASQGKVFGFYQGSDLRPKAFTYNPITGEITGPVNIGGSGLTGDSHGAPTMCIDSSGYIHVFWGCHTSTVYWRNSVNPYDITEWGTQKSSVTGSFSYPSVFYYDGYWYLFHRTQSTYPLGWGWNRTADFASLGGLTEVIKSASSSDAYYTLTGQSTNGNVHLAWCIWDGAKYKNLYYAYTSDLVTWRKADGTAYGSLPINTSAAECVYTGDNCRASCGCIQFDSNNYPHIIINNNLVWTHAGWDGEEWTVSAICADSAVNLHVPANLVILADNDFRVYLNYSPAGDTNAVHADLREYRSTDGGSTWTRHNVICGDMYRGCLNNIVNGIEGCRFMFTGSENSGLDVCIF